VSTRRGPRPREAEEQATARQSTAQPGGPAILTVVLTPETWVIAPLVTREQLERWREVGWIDEEGLHLDRAFPRNSQGLPVIFRKWLRAPMIKACRQLADVDFERCREVVNTFSIADESGVPVEYVVIPRPPLRYRRHIAPGKSEFFEYLDSTTKLTFRAVTRDPKLFVQVLALAGKVGLLGKTSYGYGKFSVSVKVE